MNLLFVRDEKNVVSQLLGYSRDLFRRQIELLFL